MYRSGGTTGQPSPLDNQGRRSGFVSLLPFFEQGPMWDRIKAGTTSPPRPPEGPNAWASWTPWNNSPDVLLCPSDSGYPHRNGRFNSYAFSMGDQVERLTQGISGQHIVRGPFSPRPLNSGGRRGNNHYTCSMADIIDGTSNTVALSERLNQANTLYRAQNPVTVAAQTVEHVLGVHTRVGGLINTPGLCWTVTDGKYFVANSPIQARFGIAWQDAQPMYVAFNAVLPPNGPRLAPTAEAGETQRIW